MLNVVKNEFHLWKLVTEWRGLSKEMWWEDTLLQKLLKTETNQLGQTGIIGQIQDDTFRSYRSSHHVIFYYVVMENTRGEGYEMFKGFLKKCWTFFDNFEKSIISYLSLLFLKIGERVWQKFQGTVPPSP